MSFRPKDATRVEALRNNLQNVLSVGVFQQVNGRVRDVAPIGLRLTSIGQFKEARTLMEKIVSSLVSATNAEASLVISKKLDGLGELLRAYNWSLWLPYGEPFGEPSEVGERVHEFLNNQIIDLINEAANRIKHKPGVTTDRGTPLYDPLFRAALMIKTNTGVTTDHRDSEAYRALSKIYGNEELYKSGALVDTRALVALWKLLRDEYYASH